jgi:hypothetical protein
MRESVSCHRVDLHSQIVDAQARNIGDDVPVRARIVIYPSWRSQPRIADARSGYCKSGIGAPQHRMKLAMPGDTPLEH